METGHDKMHGSIRKRDISGWVFMEKEARIGKLLSGAH